MPDYPGQIPAMIPNVDQYARFKQAQEQAMQAHKQYAQQLDQKQNLLQQRGADLNVADRLLKLLDSRLPKPARQFLAKELAQHVGVDPKSENAKGVSQMLTSLDPDSLQQLRSTFASSLSQASPGQIQDTVKGVLTGQVDMNSLVGQAGLNLGGTTQDSQQTEDPGQSQNQIAGGAGGDQLGGAPAGEGTAESPFQITQGAGAPAPSGETAIAKTPTKGDVLSPTAQPFGQGAGAVQSFEGSRTVPAGSQQASPQLVGALGLDSKTTFRNNDLVQNGYQIPFDPKDQEKLATDIATRSTGLSSTISEAAELTQLFQGRPEVLGPVGSGIRTFQGTVRQVEGLLHTFAPDVKNESDPNDSQTQAMAGAASKALSKAHGLDATASDSARIQSSVLSLAYRMAIANDIPGNRLTNAIIQQNLQMIGASSSPEQFKAVLIDTLAKTTREFDETMRRTVGVSGMDIVTRKLTDADIGSMAKSADILPVDFARSLRDEAVRRQQGGGATSVQPSSPTIQEEQKTLGTLETQRKQREIDKFQQDRDLQIKQDARAEEAAARANTREDRMAAAQEANAKLQREEFDYRKAKDIKARNQHQHDKIAAAFQHFGAAIASSRGGGGGGGSFSAGPGQDVSAFRMTPPPQRVPPRPGGNR